MWKFSVLTLLIEVEYSWYVIANRLRGKLTKCWDNKPGTHKLQTGSCLGEAIKAIMEWNGINLGHMPVKIYLMTVWIYQIVVTFPDSTALFNGYSVIIVSLFLYLQNMWIIFKVHCHIVTESLQQDYITATRHKYSIPQVRNHCSF